MNDNSGDDNAYKVENVLPQMDQWSILSNVINYVQYKKNPKIFIPSQ